MAKSHKSLMTSTTADMKIPPNMHPSSRPTIPSHPMYHQPSRQSMLTLNLRMSPLPILLPLLLPNILTLLQDHPQPTLPQQAPHHPHPSPPQLFLPQRPATSPQIPPRQLLQANNTKSPPTTWNTNNENIINATTSDPSSTIKSVDEPDIGNTPVPESWESRSTSSSTSSPLPSPSPFAKVINSSSTAKDNSSTSSSSTFSNPSPTPSMVAKLEKRRQYFIEKNHYSSDDTSTTMSDSDSDSSCSSILNNPKYKLPLKHPSRQKRLISKRKTSNELNQLQQIINKPRSCRSPKKI